MILDCGNQGRIKMTPKGTIRNTGAVKEGEIALGEKN
jgi:hypothetical protein